MINRRSFLKKATCAIGGIAALSMGLLARPARGQKIGEWFRKPGKPLQQSDQDAIDKCLHELWVEAEKYRYNMAVYGMHPAPSDIHTRLAPANYTGEITWRVQTKPVWPDRKIPVMERGIDA